jgi:DNA (cytosine-5)-methyltransferase 1
MKYISVCSGIEAATTAWHHLNWKPLAFSEIEPFPSAVLAHHWPTIPNLGNMTKHHEWNITDTVDLLVGGTPCQSFSVAGLRKGLQDPRGNLALVFLGMADRFKPRWIVWENVPGVLSSNGGRDFGSFLGALVELGYGFAYRVLDAQHFGVPQRRRRVFVVGCLGDAAAATKVLSFREGLSGYLTQSGKKRKATAANASNCVDANGLQLTVGTLCADTHPGAYSGQDAYTGRLIPQHKTVGALCVRRLTPTECERLQGFPDDHTLIPWRNKPADQCPDGPRYKALGNSMAVPVMRWIGERIHKAHQEYLLNIL